MLYVVSVLVMLSGVLRIQEMPGMVQFFSDRVYAWYKFIWYLYQYPESFKN